MSLNGASLHHISIFSSCVTVCHLLVLTEARKEKVVGEVVTVSV